MTLGPLKNVTPKKCEYPLRQKKSHFWKIYPSIHTHVLYPRQYNRTRFYQKNIDEITILHRNLVCFSSFFRITICKPNLIFQKCVKSDMKYPCKIIFYFSVKSPYIKQILKIKMYIVKYTADFEKISNFWLLKKNHMLNPNPNGCFLANFEQKS